MSFIKNHGPKLLLVLVAIMCAAFLWLDSSGGGVDAAATKELDNNVDKIKKAVNNRAISDKYPYGRDNINALKYQDDATASFERSGKRFETEIPAYVAYQTPSRPRVDASTKPVGVEEMTKADDAEIRELADIKANGDHGRVFVAFKVPAKMKYMEPQRVEIFRNKEGEKEVDTKTPYATIEFIPEEAAVATAPAKDKEDTAERTTDDSDVSAAAKRRRERAGEKDPPKTTRDKKTAPAPAADIPAEYADVKVFADTHVEPKQTYYYKLRLVGKMTTTPEAKVVEKDPNGILKKITIVHAPKNATAVPPAKAGSQAPLFATPLSATVSAAPPSNFEIRLAGTSGKLDPPGTPDFKKGKEYKGTFAVRVWVTEAQAWKEITIQAAPDEKLKGALLYKDAESKENKSVEFDAGYKLVEIKWGETVVEKKVEETKLDSDGNPIFDPKTKKPVKVEVIKKSDPIPNEIALLEDTTSHKTEEFPKRADFGAREKALEYYSRIAKEQEESDKGFKVKMDKVKERLKSDDDSRKQKADADAAAAAAAAAASQPSTGGGRTQGGGAGGGRAGGREGGGGARK